MRRKTLAEFISESAPLHNNKYDYSLVNYINTHTKVEIICPVHGVFSQSPNKHIQAKTGCPSCGLEKAKSTMMKNHGVSYALQNKSIMEKQKQTMVTRYGVPHAQLNEEIAANTKRTNLARYGVEYTTQSSTSQEKKKSTFIKRYGVDNPLKCVDVRDKQKNTMTERYGVQYALQHVDIQKKLHSTIMTKYGVSHYKQLHMIDILPLLEDKEWMTTEYETTNKTTTQIAKEIGTWDGTIGRYLHKHGINVFQNNFYSSICLQWLKSIEEQEGIIIQQAPNEFKIPGTRYSADGYCKETNTIYEFHGDYWHGNPKIHNPDDWNCVLKKTMGELYQKTLLRQCDIQSRGYTLIIMWESEFNNRTM